MRSVGRCPLLVDGKGVDSAVVVPGDTLVLHDLLVLLVVSRRPAWFLERRHATGDSRGFGAPDAHGIVGESPAIWELRASLTFAAQSREHVLVCGESGAGKELAAQAVHTLSSRRGRPFVTRNAATLPEGLVDAELFGNARGYPYAGMGERPGLIGEADGGTLFLDEIGEMRHDLQAHLLRVMDRGGEYQRLGEARPRRADVRLVAATNRPSPALKHDFTARFPVRVRVPGLNERPEDIPLLVLHVLAQWRARPGWALCALFEKDAKGPAAPRVNQALVEALIQHEYTHHVRELESVLWTALSTSPGNTVELTDQLRALLRAAERPTDERPSTARTAQRGTATVAAAGGADSGPSAARPRRGPRTPGDPGGPREDGRQGRPCGGAARSEPTRLAPPAEAVRPARIGRRRGERGRLKRRLPTCGGGAARGWLPGGARARCAGTPPTGPAGLPPG